MTTESRPEIRETLASLTDLQRAEIAALREGTAMTRRATVPAMEELLYVPLPVLDHGFVRVIDYMGDDGAVVQAARVSYGTGTKRRRDDAGLIGYLMRHRHTSPFEMCEIKVHAKMPIFVARQWIRHRTACLAGETVLYFDLPGGLRRRGRARFNMPISKLYRLWHEGTTHPLGKKKRTYIEVIDPEREYTVPELAKLTYRRQETFRNVIAAGRLLAEKRRPRTPTSPQLFIRGSAYIAWAQRVLTARVDMRPRISRMRLRMCDETTGEIVHTQITDVWSTGVRPVFRVTLVNGYSAKMTKDHLCLTESGWRTLEEATRLKRNDAGGVSWDGSAPRFAVNGVHPHRDDDWLRKERAAGLSVTQMAELAGVSYQMIRVALRTHGLQFSAAEKARLSGFVQRGQRRSFARARIWTPEALERVRTARSGSASNFWKGGVTKERALVGAWTVSHAQAVHRRNGYRCVICGSGDRLNAHHIDPVWHAPQRARELSNLTSLCARCHKDLHGLNLELALLVDVRRKRDLAAFWERHPRARRPPPIGRRRANTRLVRGWSAVAKIEYAGQEETYDLSVAGPFHNFVANGFVVHNSVNEYSARFSILDREFYVPAADQLATQSPANRQGRGETLDVESARHVLDILRADAERAYDDYEDLLGEGDRPGLARELARMNLSVNFYTQWYWKVDLHNLLGFIRLRADAHAQYEIRAYADVLLDIVRQWVPLTYTTFMDYRMGGVELSAKGIEVVRRLVRGERVEQSASGMSPGEWRDLMETLGL